jgi:NIPSNAP
MVPIRNSPGRIQCVGTAPVVELRQYTLRPGRREDLIELFDRELVEPQEDAGMRILGQFRDVDRPDRFVWLRSFPDMILRKHALETFYGGPTWKAHRAAANATMVDVDDVLLLRPVTPSSGFAALPPRPGLRDPVPGTTLTATVCSLDEPADVEALEQDLLPRLAAFPAPALATFVEEPYENTFPHLPVRAGEHVVVWIQRAGSSAQDPWLQASAELAQQLLPGLVAPALQIRLEPTLRSRLR